MFKKENIPIFAVIAYSLIVAIITGLKGRTWYVDALLIFGLFIFLIFLDHKVKISFTSKIIISLAILFHLTSGLFNWYGTVANIDKYIHFFACFALYFVVYELIDDIRFRTAFFCIWIVSGLANLVEIIELIFPAALGGGEGILFLGPEDSGWIDIKWDMIANLSGAVLGFFFILFKRKDSIKKRISFK